MNAGNTAIYIKEKVEGYGENSLDRALLLAVVHLQQLGRELQGFAFAGSVTHNGAKLLTLSYDGISRISLKI